MSTIDIKRLELDLLKIAAAKAELELKIEERKLDISRMRDHIKLQEIRENDINDKLKTIKGK